MHNILIRDLLEEIEPALQARLYRPALVGALVIPDIAGALDAVDGEATGARYAAWFDQHVAQRFRFAGKQGITGGDCYQYRCVLLHQGRQRHPRSRYLQSTFTVPTQDARFGAHSGAAGNTVLIDVPTFCRNIVDGAYEWLEIVEDTPLFKANSVDALPLFSLTFRE